MFCCLGPEYNLTKRHNKARACECASSFWVKPACKRLWLLRPFQTLLRGRISLGAYAPDEWVVQRTVRDKCLTAYTLFFCEFESWARPCLSGNPALVYYKRVSCRRRISAQQSTMFRLMAQTAGSGLILLGIPVAFSLELCPCLAF